MAHIWGYENKLNLFNYRGILHDLIKCKRNVADGIVPALSASLVCENSGGVIFGAWYKR